jgi:hypothetical protein
MKNIPSLATNARGVCAEIMLWWTTGHAFAAQQKAAQPARLLIQLLDAMGFQFDRIFDGISATRPW